MVGSPTEIGVKPASMVAGSRVSHAMSSRSLGHRAPLLWLVGPLMAGLAAGKAKDFAPVVWLLAGALAAATAALFFAWRESRWWAAAIGVTMFLAAASYTLHRARLARWEALPPREVRVSVRVDRVFPQSAARRASAIGRVVKAGSSGRIWRGSESTSPSPSLGVSRLPCAAPS
jgi:hypothetical protein